MNPTDVQEWLIEEVHVPISIAAKFAEAGVDGELLIRYEEQHLQKDFELPTGVMRKIIYARDDRMKTRVNTHQHHPLASEKHTDNLSVDAGSIDVLASDATVVSQENKRDEQLTEVTSPVQKTKSAQDGHLGKSMGAEMSQQVPLSKEEGNSGGSKATISPDRRREWIIRQFFPSHSCGKQTGIRRFP